MPPRGQILELSFEGCLLVALGSALGGVARHLLASLLSGRTAAGAEFPWGIFAVNITGSFLLGLLLTLLSLRQESLWPGWKLLLGTGFCGGFTTFSTLMWDTWRLGPRIGFLNLIASGVFGYLAVCLATWLASLLAPRLPAGH